MGYAMCSHELQAPKLRGKTDHGQSAELLRWTTAAGDCRGMQEIRCGGKIVSGEGDLWERSREMCSPETVQNPRANATAMLQIPSSPKAND